MTTDIHAALGLLARTPPTADLDGFEDAVLGAVRAQRQQAGAGRMALGLVSVAAMMGLGGAFVPTESVHAAPVAPFGAPHPLAPSSLLLGEGE